MNEPSKKIRLNIYDLNGKSVFQSYDYETDHAIDLSNLNSGTYILIAVIDDIKITKRLIKG